MEEKKELNTEAQTTAKEENGKLSEELKTLVSDIVIEFKKSGSMTTAQLLDKLEKYDAGPNDIEEVYKILESSGIQVINEYERDKEFYDQLLQEVSMDDPVKMYLKDIGKVPLLQPDE
ncbi:MAG: sigma-70 factor domain-containing protein, partial [Candidatus Borkfalkiaceae bacterium]|nr:sigma-70 factor domain-containing protein [Christensenellaceae bacterium]